METFALDKQGRALGVDVSYYNSTIDWKAAKADGIDFAIIRIGFGDNETKQDDSKARENMAGCQEAGIPFGVYLYSYAISEKEVISEVDHTLRMIEGYNPEMGIWFDMEDADYYKERHGFNPYTHGSQLTDFCIQYMNRMKAKGYSNVGVYANKDFFNNILDYDALSENGLIWLAHWGVSSPDLDCDIWQYSDAGKVKGIPGSGLDMNMILPDSALYYLVADVPQEPEEPKDSIGGDVTVGGKTFRCGDVNHDGVIDIIDLALVKKHILGKTTLKDEVFQLGDINHDELVDIIDLASIKKHILGKIDLTYREKIEETTQESKETVEEKKEEREETTEEKVTESEATTEEKTTESEETTEEKVTESETTTEEQKIENEKQGKETTTEDSTSVKGNITENKETIEETTEE